MTALREYDSWMRGSGLPESTRKLRNYHLRRLAVTTGLEPFEATVGELSAYLASRPWGSYTRRAVRSTIKTFYQWAQVAGYVDRSPAEFLPSVSAPLGKPRPAAEDAIEVALSRADERVRLMVRLGANVGLRCCEIAAVSAEAVTRTAGGWSLRVIGKGSKVRVVPISDFIAREIQNAGPGYIFPGQIEGHLSASYVSKLISQALPSGVTAHQLRHRFASRAYRGQKNIRAVQELLGHASVATTQIYTAVDSEDLRAAMSAAA